MGRSLSSALFVAGIVALLSPTAAAQGRPRPVVEAVTGWGGFVDEVWIGRTMIGFGGRVFVTPRIAIGPEVVFLGGADGERDWTLTGNVTIDLVAEAPGAVRRAVPYLAIGGGYLSQTTRVGSADSGR